MALVENFAGTRVLRSVYANAVRVFYHFTHEEVRRFNAVVDAALPLVYRGDWAGHEKAIRLHMTVLRRDSRMRPTHDRPSWKRRHHVYAHVVALLMRELGGMTVVFAAEPGVDDSFVRVVAQSLMRTGDGVKVAFCDGVLACKSGGRTSRLYPARRFRGAGTVRVDLMLVDRCRPPKSPDATFIVRRIRDSGDTVVVQI